MSAANHSNKIRFFQQGSRFTLQNRTELKLFIEKLFSKYRKRLRSLNYIFTTDAGVLKINQDFLGHDYYTDIITFDLGNPDAVEAEIYISIDRVRENARSHKTSFQQELHRVMFHGVLHLCGLQDKSPSELAAMRKAEEYHLIKYLKN